MYVYVNLQEEGTSISIGSSPVCDLRFAHNIDFIAGTDTELRGRTNKLDLYGIKLNRNPNKL